MVNSPMCILMVTKIQAVSKLIQYLSKILQQTSSQVIANKVLVSPINVVNSDNAGVWGYSGFTSTAPKTITNSSSN